MITHLMKEEPRPSLLYLFTFQNLRKLAGYPVEILVEGQSVCRMPFVYFFLVYYCSKSSLSQSRSEQYW